MRTLTGLYLLAGESASQQTRLTLLDNGDIRLHKLLDDAPIRSATADSVSFGSAIPGLPVDLIFADKATFTPDDVYFRWPSLSQGSRFIEWLESHIVAIIAATILVPIIFWWIITRAVPTTTALVVPHLPTGVADVLGEHTLTLLDKSMFDDTSISDEQQASINDLWFAVINPLPLAHPHYQLLFRDSAIGANAIALPDGTVVVTDDLITLLTDKPNALKAVLLHEIGHIEYQHSLQMITQSTITAVIYTMLAGDIDGAGEAVIGAGVGLLQNAYSRDMEAEADNFAFNHAPDIGISANDFATAMRSLAASHGVDPEADSDDYSWEELLHTHPDIKERIDRAENAAALESKP